MTDDQKVDLIKQEYFKLQDFYEDFDKRAQVIKGWSITIALAGIASSFIYKVPYLCLLSSVSALIFWRIETLWKTFQFHYRRRIKEIEEKIRLNDITSIVPLQMYKSWFESYYEGEIRMKDVMFITNVYMPHLYIFLIGLICFFIQFLGLIKLNYCN